MNRLASWPELHLLDLPVWLVPLSTLPAEPILPRRVAESGPTSTLTESQPILLHGSTARVIEGLDRLRFAVAGARTEVEVCLFEGTIRQAVLLAARAAVLGGLSLSTSDRSAIVAWTLRAYPEWSDRLIAEVAGLSPTTVATTRRRLGASGGSGPRIGRDGRARPVSSAEARRRAGELFAARPGALLREVALEAGVALSTAQDVRKRMRAGLDPVPSGIRARPTDGA
ncbi:MULTISPECIES: hypothetical protein [unclassified Crossiella]|uniref:hypothetical protein n=1 Tax=unclassified Crossiella TaxID=2620835 RepID=UPI001FFEA427|nr:MULTISPECIES: hypothetical protein [unclassified Crossiella]MCK2244407.1 hypothetical protein [Crossiella sp. S99.2]MCK2257765.1 hypothetical protein [Crossiella sp. S99.1]